MRRNVGFAVALFSFLLLVACRSNVTPLDPGGGGVGGGGDNGGAGGHLPGGDVPDGSIGLAMSSPDGPTASSTPDLSIAPGPGTDASSPAACTGPQDCSSAVPICCVTSQLGSSSGSASSICSASCPGNVSGT